MRLLRIENRKNTELFAMVDDNLYSFVSRFHWRRVSTGIIVTARSRNMYGKCNAHLARFVAGVCDRKFDVIHIDGNPLNCQKANLVVVTRGVARAKARKTRTRESTSTYKGMIWQRATAASEPDSLLVAPDRC